MSNELDLTIIEGLREILGERFSKLVDSYVNDCGKRIERLSIAIETEDYNAIAHEAHGLKGSSRNVGANALAGLCEEVEKHGRARENADIATLFSTIEKKFAAVCEELKGI